MLKSMTGYGKSVCELKGKIITFEIKTLNSKQFDIYLRTPSFLRNKEMEFRSLASKYLERGKIDLSINSVQSEVSSEYSFNTVLAKKYFNELKKFSAEINESPELLPLLLKMPDVLKKEPEEINDDEWLKIKTSLEEAFVLVDQHRMDEGKTLAKDINSRITIILNLLQQIEPFEKSRIEVIRTKLMNGFNQNFKDEKLDKDRFEQEIIYYLEKLDFTEEKVRLKNHCEYFLQTSEENSSGRKLGFIAQEIGREINTIGSKASEVNIQKLVVMMKDELEKIKEQLLNIL